jgi:hypothetical protein
MSEHAITTGVSILLAVMGLAIVAVIVSSQSKTTGVLTSGGGAIQQLICTALSPVTGAGCKSLTSLVTSTINYG